MALTNPQATSDIVSGQPVGKAAFGDKVINNLNGLDTRLTTDESNITTLQSTTTNVSTGNSALGTRTTALETLTGATGSTAAGNAALSTRLGTGVTTASTATAQFTSATGRLTVLETAAPMAKYTKAATTQTSGASWLGVVLENPLISHAAISVNGAGNEFTINTPGLWMVTAVVSTGGGAGQTPIGQVNLAITQNSGTGTSASRGTEYGTNSGYAGVVDRGLYVQTVVTIRVATTATVAANTFCWAGNTVFIVNTNNIQFSRIGN